MHSYQPCRSCRSSQNENVPYRESNGALHAYGSFQYVCSSSCTIRSDSYTTVHASLSPINLTKVWRNKLVWSCHLCSIIRTLGLFPNFSHRHSVDLFWDICQCRYIAKLFPDIGQVWTIYFKTFFVSVFRLFPPMSFYN